MVVVVLANATIYIPSNDLVDMQEAIKKLQDKKQKLANELLRSEKMLSNQSFISKAPQSKIDAEMTKKRQYQEQYDEVCKTLSMLENK